MVSASALNFLANIMLVASFIALGTSVSLQFSKSFSTEAAETGRWRTAAGYADGDSSAEAATIPKHLAATAVRPAVLLESERLSPILTNEPFSHLAPLRVTKTDAVAGAARAAAAPAEAKLAMLPVKDGIIFEDVGKKACIGGSQCYEHCKIEVGGCEVRPAYVIRLERPAYLAALQLYAHDQVGPSRQANLLVKVNGEPVGKAEVYRFGSTLSVKIDRVGQLVTIESLHRTHGFLSGGEEAVIWDLYLIGREPR